MRVSKRLLHTAALLGSFVAGSAFSPGKPSDFNTAAGYSSDEGADNVPSHLHHPGGDVGRFCDELRCSYDDYQAIIHQLKIQREALALRTQAIDGFLGALQPLEENRIGTDPMEIPRLAERARSIFQNEQLQLEESKNDQQPLSSDNNVPHPPKDRPTLGNLLAQEYNDEIDNFHQPETPVDPDWDIFQ